MFREMLVYFLIYLHGTGTGIVNFYFCFYNYSLTEFCTVLCLHGIFFENNGTGTSFQGEL
jgi:hypothetical protein